MTEQMFRPPSWVQSLCADLRSAGEIRLADILLRLPAETGAGHGGRVAAIAPEALAAAGNMRHPWLELYVRHWALKCRLDVAGEGAAALAEAWSLTEFSLRPDVRDCPQALSVIGDLVTCHSNMDGPGKGPDCLDLCSATVRVTDPSSPEFTALSLAEARIHMDAGDAEKAASLLHNARFLRSRACGGDEPPLFAPRLALALHRSGKSREALAVLNPAVSGADATPVSVFNAARQTGSIPPGFDAFCGLVRSLILAEYGTDPQEAWRALPRWTDIIPALHEPWTATAYAVALKIPANNTWELGALLQTAINHAQSVGAHHAACLIAHRHARLAIARGSAWTAGRALAATAEALPLLRAPGDLPDMLEECVGDLAALPARPRLPVPATSLVAFCASQTGPRDPEKDIALFRRAAELRPDDAAVTLALAAAMQACRAFTEAAACLRAAVERNPGDGACFSALITLLAQQGKHAEIDEVAAFLAASAPEQSEWGAAFAAYSRSDWDAAAEQARKILDHAPESRHARRLLAESAMRKKDFSLARDQYQELARDKESGESDRWDLMTAAAAAEDWKTVRRTARALQLDPVSATAEDGTEENWGLAHLYFFEEGEWREYIGRRTGPVTAKILAAAPPFLTQHAGDLVVFAAQPLQPEKPDSPGTAPSFRVVHVLRPGRCTAWQAAGADPGLALRMELRDALHTAGIALWGETPENYRVRDPQNPDGEGLPGLSMQIVVPDSILPEEADTLLQRLTAHWPHPLCWPDLAEAAGADPSPHRLTIKEYVL